MRAKPEGCAAALLLQSAAWCCQRRALRWPPARMQKALVLCALGQWAMSSRYCTILLKTAHQTSCDVLDLGDGRNVGRMKTAGGMRDDQVWNRTPRQWRDESVRVPSRARARRASDRGEWETSPFIKATGVGNRDRGICCMWAANVSVSTSVSSGLLMYIYGACRRPFGCNRCGHLGTTFHKQA
jgi:hypothetical protein